jgi:ATP-dependent helicase HrpA
MKKTRKNRGPVEQQRLLERRRELCPIPVFDESLPVNQHRDEIARLIDERQVVIVCGETGSGKTTQIPKICLQSGRGINGLIAHTQPRRLAARSVAARIASELKTEIGQAVGFQIRFTDRTSPDSYIKLMTDGILLAETRRDRLLRAYDTIIIDEAHERSLNIDYLLGYLKTILPRRPDLKIIITSATIDPQSFSSFFSDAPVVEVSGRSYPVETRYRSLVSEDEDERDRDMLQGIIHAVDELDKEEAGDILVFVSGEREIREAADALQRHVGPQREILPLYSRLSVHEQDRIFTSGGHRRIIISTNVAETSLTVPGIRHVIDTGLARISRYSYRSKVQHLPIEPISQASANQRQGRCGRNAPGVCIRLYSEDDFMQRPLFTDPEILRTNLASVILSLINLRMGKVEDFPFINPPDQRVVRDGYRLLEELDAISMPGKITPTGRELARLPIDPRLGRMLIEAQKTDCLNEALVICSCLSIQDPRERPHHKREQAAQKHREFNVPDSDFMTLLNIWQTFRKQGKQLSQNQLRKWCRQHYLSWMRMREWTDILKQLTRQLHHRESEQLTAASSDTIHRALLSGLLSHIGQHDEGREYRGPRQRQFSLAPDSVLVKKTPRWIMSASLVQTHRLFARMNARIEPEWIEKAAGERCQKHYSEPRWVRSQGRVVASEQVSVFGLVVIAGRPVHYGPIDPQVSREIFIREALVAGNYHFRSRVMSDNRKLIEEIEGVEHKRRRHDLVDEDAIYRFYDKRIPDHITQARSFERWLRQEQKNDPDMLRLQRDDLLAGETTLADKQFPDHLLVGTTDFHLTYHFEPGHALDGVTAHIPVQYLKSINEADFDWLVPGLIREKLTLLLKSLPKSRRRQLVPIPETVSGFLEWADNEELRSMPLVEALGKYLRKKKNIAVANNDWQAGLLPDHLRMGFRILDADGRTLEVGRDLAALQQEFAGRATEVFAKAPEWDIKQENISAWDFGELPYSVTQKSGHSQVTGYPCLCVDENAKISIDVCDNPEMADQLHHAGLQALILKLLPEQQRYLDKQLPGLKQQCLYYTSIGSCSELHGDLVAAIIDTCFLEANRLPRDQDSFEAMLARGRGCVTGTAVRFAELNLKTLELYHRCSVEIEESSQRLPEDAQTDIQQQMENLVYPGYLQHTGLENLRHYPRYLRGILVRLEKAGENPARDALAREQLSPFMTFYLEQAEKWPELSAGQQDKLESIHMMIEEFRISLFAQQLGTNKPVSGKRLQKLISAYGEL